jgi:hypothetical protein
MNPFLLVKRGVAVPEQWTLEPGIEVTIGGAADWLVRAPGMLPIHASVYFDGRKLFVMSHDLNETVYLSGVRVYGEWIPVAIGAQIAIAQAIITYLDAAEVSRPPELRSLSQTLPLQRSDVAPALQKMEASPDSERTQFVQPKTAPAANPPSYSPPVTPPNAALQAAPQAPAAPDSERTRIGQPLVKRPAPPDSGRTRVGAVVALGSSRSLPQDEPLQPQQQPLQSQQQPLLVPPPAVAAPKATSEMSIGEQWRVMSNARKATVLLAPFVAAALSYIFFFDDEPVAQTRATIDAGQVPSSTTSIPAVVAVVTVPQLPPTMPEPLPLPVVILDAGAKDASRRISTTPSASATIVPKTKERLASDALAAGDFARAAQLYQELGDPGSLEIARILRSKVPH